MPLQGAASGAIGTAVVSARAAGFVKTYRLICRTALPLLLCAPGAAFAQAETAPPPEEIAQVAFSADQLIYDENADTVTATGDVRLNG